MPQAAHAIPQTRGWDGVDGATQPVRQNRNAQLKGSEVVSKELLNLVCVMLLAAGCVTDRAAPEVIRMQPG